MNQEKAAPSLSRRSVLVTGASGFIGSALVEALGLRAIGLSRECLDITRPDEIARALDDFEPIALVNAAALADVDRSEREPELARRLNQIAPGLLARACAARGVAFTHLSTDYVFDGLLDRPYRVDDPTRALNHYGESKRLGELAVLEAHPRAQLARVAWVYGPGGKGFAGPLPFKLARGESVQAIRDRFGHVTYVRDAAERIVALLDLGVPGIYHVVNQGPATWAEFSLRLARRLAVPERLVEAVSFRDLPPRAVRPRGVALEADPGRPGLKLPPLRHWEEAQDAWLLELIRSAEGTAR